MKTIISAVFAAVLFALCPGQASAAAAPSAASDLRLLSKQAPSVEHVYYRRHWRGGRGWGHRHWGHRYRWRPHIGFYGYGYGYGHRRHCWWRYGYRHCRWRGW